MPSPFWSGFGWGGSEQGPAPDEEQAAYGAPKSIQEGLLQIGSQACHILVHRIDSAAAEALQRQHQRPRPSARASAAAACPDGQGRPRPGAGSRPGPHQSRSPKGLGLGHGHGLGHDPEQYVVLLSDQSLPRASASRPGPPPASATASAAAPRPTRPPHLALGVSPLAFDHRKASVATVAPSKKLSSVPDDDVDQWGSRFLVRSEEDLALPHHSQHSKWSSRGWCKPAYIPISIILIMIVLVVLLPLLEQSEHWDEKLKLDRFSCLNTCRISLVESIPEGLTYPREAPKFPSTYEAWDQLINISRSSIEIAALYFTLRGADIYQHPSAYQGEDIFKKLMNASIERNIKLKIAQNTPSRDMPGTDTEELAKKGLADVRSLNFPKLLGAGVLHTKFWIVDGKHVYIGSANMDWRSLTQVKEMGAVLYDCPCIANDIQKIFNVYWDLGKDGAVVPPKWPASYSTTYNLATPMNVSVNGVQANIFLSSSPPPFSPSGRSDDADTIVGIISKAEKFVYIAVMDYIPMMIYTPRPKYWPLFNNALLAAAINNKVNVRLLMSSWNHTRKVELKFLKSLEDVSSTYKNVNIEVKLFKVPATPDQQKIPFSRVNHNKYMVTDNTAYIGTSNWSGDYFVNTAGVGLVMQPTTSNRKQNTLPIRDQLQSVFERDWNSPYATSLSELTHAEVSSYP